MTIPLRDVRRQVGQLLVAGFAGRDLPVELRALAREFDLGGVILFARNVEEPAQVADLAHAAAGLGRESPAWVSVDQEGGRVARLRRPFTEWPPMAALGRSGDGALAGRFASALAAELNAVGVTLDYAPVLDVRTSRTTPAIGDRALSDDPRTVARLGRVIVETLQKNGIAACAKHFPGHGDTSCDSHDALPVIDLPPDHLRAVDWVPFREAIAAEVGGVMMGHLLVPSLDETRPASLSRHLVEEVLRGELGHAGPVFTDDLDMGAVRGDRPVGELVVDAVAAGCDVLLICGERSEPQLLALEALIKAAESGVLSRSRIDQALRRQRALKERFLAGRVERVDSRRLRAVVGCAAHRLVADEIARCVE